MNLRSRLRVAALCAVVSTVMPADPLLSQPLEEQPRNADREVLIADQLHAKQLPTDLKTQAMVFTGPAGDGRRGSAGFIVNGQELLGDGGAGTGWHFTFQRDPSGFGFQIIHPFKDGHVLIAVGSAVTIHRGGSWTKIGWGDPSSSDRVEPTAAGKRILPLKPGVPHSVVSQLSHTGRYLLWMDGSLVCQHLIEKASRLELESKGRIWGGSSWNGVSFAGPKFRTQLQPGEAGLILSPMDGAGPRHRFEDITLARLWDAASREDDGDFAPLFARIDNLREAGQLTLAPRVGGSRGGDFEVLSTEASVLTGFQYTASRLYAGHLTIKAIRPIFRNRQGQWRGDWLGRPTGKVRQVKAREGYVVAGAVAKGGNRVDGMRLIFMRVHEGRLNPDDTYRSDWIGGRGGHPETLYAANGHPIVGLHGRTGADLDSLGFIQANPSPPLKPARSLKALMPHLTGKWLVTYMNKTKHTREIHANQRVNDNAEISESSGDILIYFPDVIERVTLVGEQLFIEHFNPSSTYPDGTPAAMGIGRRIDP